jgi:hypothetical protein
LNNGSYEPIGKENRCYSRSFRCSWARLEILAGLLQEVLLISLSLSIIVDAVNKLINPNHIEDASAMIFLGSAGVSIGLLGLVLFRGYHHDHNIGHEIVEQKKNDFVRSVYTTLRNLDMNSEHAIEQEQVTTNSRMSTVQVKSVPEVVITDLTSTVNVDQRKKRQFQQDLILPSLNETYKNAFIVADTHDDIEQDTNDDINEQQLCVPTHTSASSTRSRSKSGDSMISSTTVLEQDENDLDDEFRESRIFATLHALCLHSLVSSIVQY